MKRFLLAASVALLLSSTGAFASPWQGGGHGRGDHDRSWQGDNDRGDRRGDRDDRDWHDRRDWRERGYHDNGRHLGWYKRGGRMPVMYLQPRYYVTDYRAYGLAPPPYGTRWVRPYGDDRYLLVQVATGLIMQVLGY